MYDYAVLTVKVTGKDTWLPHVTKSAMLLVGTESNLASKRFLLKSNIWTYYLYWFSSVQLNWLVPIEPAMSLSSTLHGVGGPLPNQIGQEARAQVQPDWNGQPDLVSKILLKEQSKERTNLMSATDMKTIIIPELASRATVIWFDGYKPQGRSNAAQYRQWSATN